MVNLWQRGDLASLSLSSRHNFFRYIHIPLALPGEGIISIFFYQETNSVSESSSYEKSVNIQFIIFLTDHNGLISYKKMSPISNKLYFLNKSNVINYFYPFFVYIFSFGSFRTCEFGIWHH